MAKLIVLTGAGLSVESGVRTFRDNNGLWENHSIEQVCNGATWRANFDLVHQFYNDRRAQLSTVEPNPAHRAIARWQSRYETILLTQNVDDLLERAGCHDVVHLNGFLPEMQCVDCGHVWNIGYVEWQKSVNCPQCPSVRAVRVSTTVLATSALAPLPALLLGSALQLTTFYESWSEAIRQPRFASEMFRAQQAAITSGDAAAYQKFVDDLRARAIVGRDTRIANERSQRLPILVGVGLFLIVVAGVTFTTRRWQPFAGAVLYTAGWYAIFTLARGHLFSLAMFGNSDPTAFLAGLARDSTVLLIVVTAIIALTTGRHDDGLDAITTVLNTVLLIVCVQVGQAAWFYFQWGAQFSWALPDSQSLVAAMAALTQISALSLRIVPELPNLPIPLLIAVLSLIIYTLVRHKEEPGRYGRLR